MKSTKAIEKQLKSTAKHQNIIIRGRIIWIDFQKNKVRLRKSTRLKYSPPAFNFVKKNYDKYLEKGAEIWLKKDFIAYENSLVAKRLNKKEFVLNNAKKHDYFTISRLIDDFLAEKSFLKISTQRTQKAICDVILKFIKFKNLKFVYEIQRKTSLDFTNFLLNNGVVTKQTFRTYFFIFNSLLKLAVKQGIIDENPLFYPKVSILIEPEKKPFSLDEVEIILKNATGSIRTYLFIAFFTGMRTGEILALTWGDIDFENKEIKVTKTQDLTSYEIHSPKTASSYRNIDLLDILAKELLPKKKSDSNRIFTENIWEFRRKFKELLKFLNISDRKLYDTRHTFASIMLSKGEEPMWVGCKMLGHKNLNQTYKSYAKYLPKDCKSRANFLVDLRI